MNEEDDGHTKSYLLQLEKMNINFGKIERNLPIATLIEIAIQRNEGLLSNSGALSVKTGKFTGRSPDDKFIVDDEITHSLVDWGKVNHSISTEKFDKIFERMKQHVSGRDFFYLTDLLALILTIVCQLGFLPTVHGTTFLHHKYLYGRHLKN
jgi:phosphoenolpyruvate carboxykinase (ATP)